MTIHARARLNSVDAMRGIASLAVCWFHMTNSYSASSFARISGQYGWLGVEMFFVLSGFIIPYAMFMGGYSFKTDWLTFISKRILRIEPPYLIAIILVFGLWHVSALVPGFKGSSPPPFFSAQTALHVGYLTGIAGYPWLNVVFWTLAIKFQFYLLISLIYGWIGRKRSFTVFIVNLALMGISLVLNSDVFVFRYLSLFMMGIIAFQYRSGLFDKRKTAFLLFASLIFVGLGLGWMIAGVGMLTSLLILSNLELGRQKIIFWLGSISYSLYLVHVPVGGRVVNLGRRYVESQSGEVFLSVAGLGVSLIAAHYFYMAIERPAQRLAARLKYSCPVGNM